jgi:hypothetical protein
VSHDLDLEAAGANTSGAAADLVLFDHLLCRVKRSVHLRQNFGQGVGGDLRVGKEEHSIALQLRKSQAAGACPDDRVEQFVDDQVGVGQRRFVGTDELGVASDVCDHHQDVAGIRTGREFLGRMAPKATSNVFECKG